jgi:hypothetical protein
MENILPNLAISMLHFVMFPPTHQVSWVFKVIAIIAIACDPYYTSAYIKAPSAQNVM